MRICRGAQPLQVAVAQSRTVLQPVEAAPEEDQRPEEPTPRLAAELLRKEAVEHRKDRSTLLLVADERAEVEDSPRAEIELAVGVAELSVGWTPGERIDDGTVVLVAQCLVDEERFDLEWEVKRWC